MKAWWLYRRVYAAWLALSVVAYGVTYFCDPYIFAFTVLGLGTLSLGVTVVGALGAIIGLVTDHSRRRDCGILLVLSLLIGMTSLVGVRVVQGLRWN